MRAGSVLFFKRIILFGLLIALPVSIAGCGFFAVCSIIGQNKHEAEIARLSVRIQELESAARSSRTTGEGTYVNSLSEPDPMSANSSDFNPPDDGSEQSAFLNGESTGKSEPVLNHPDAQARGDQTSACDTFRLDFFSAYASPSDGVNQDSESSTPLKVAYLTFDDGPSERTLEILKVLDEFKVKATFFVINKKDERSASILKETASRGHTIGMHSSSHDRQVIYQSAESYLKDISENYDYILQSIGIKPTLFRFAGGSSNAFNKETGTYDALIEMNRRGFICFDWNCSFGDATGEVVSQKTILKNVQDSFADRNTLVILAHDSAGKFETVKALPDVIRFLQQQEYQIKALDPTVQPILYASTRKALETYLSEREP